MPQDFIDRLRARCAKLAVGPSTLRGRGTVGVIAAVRRSLIKIDLATLAVTDPGTFELRLSEITRLLSADLPEAGRAWGRARKAINIFLRDVVYNADLRDYYGLQHIRAWLEVPLDSHVAKGLLGEPESCGLRRWPGIKYLTPTISKVYQTVASKVATRYRVCRVDLDVFYWRAAISLELLST